MRPPDTYACLWGKPADNSAAVRARTGRALATIQCPCGGSVGSVHVGGEGPLAVLRGRRLTRPHVAEELLEAYLRDFESVAEHEADGRLTESDRIVFAAISALSRAFDPLMGSGSTDVRQSPLVAAVTPLVTPMHYPDYVHHLSGLAEDARNLGVHMRDSAGHLRRRLGEMDATCNKCRRVWYLGAQLVAWMSAPESARPKLLVAEHEAELVARSTWADSFPASAFERRAALYTWLSEALSSTAQRE